VDIPSWAIAIRTAANGRLEVRCRTCGRYFWLSEREATWSVCPHCEGWWRGIPLDNVVT
jgi:Zn finger protein HypA/HybF involved in hydrogenase expression